VCVWLVDCVFLSRKTTGAASPEYSATKYASEQLYAVSDHLHAVFMKSGAAAAEDCAVFEGVLVFPRES
jgi:hypothetical protein